MAPAVDVDELTVKVQQVYRQVAQEPHADFHFELGRGLAERLGYSAEVLDQVPADAIESFAGVGHFLDLAVLADGERVLDLGSGSGTDAFAAAALVGSSGHVVGVDFTVPQLDKARRIASDASVSTVEFREGHIEHLPVEDGSFDCVISNGVINLSPDKTQVFREVARALRRGGRLALADIVSQRQVTAAIACNADLWASCIGGAAQVDDYLASIEAAGLHVSSVRDNPQYRFLSGSARGATKTYGIKSISVLAVKPG
jgi:ubiquinone/menaquinone biosynthesis C-methylase UbiE